jgi:hypothetical protein
MTLGHTIFLRRGYEDSPFEVDARAHELLALPAAS